MRWTLGAVAAALLVAAAGACGSVISVPDQGLIVTGCQIPAQCIRADCGCNRALDGCVVPCTQTDPNDPSTCYCMPVASGSTSVQTQCIETAQACVGRGALCGGTGAMCQPVGTTCGQSGVTAVPPMLVPSVGMPAFEPHCQFTDDVCCAGITATDGGVPMTD
ncbi:MAG TPA: hypothetical protein VN947_34815 [Polyangia bacterium]|nr:hypothetical protein [Polyangia bacterium]